MKKAAKRDQKWVEEKGKQMVGCLGNSSVVVRVYSTAERKVAPTAEEKVASSGKALAGMSATEKVDLMVAWMVEKMVE